MPARLVARDLVALVVCAVLWIVAARTPGWATAIPTAIVTGLCGFLLHEWGHLAGARFAGSVVHFPDRVLAPLLFHFDGKQNTRQQFIAMSVGGYVGSVLGIVIIVGLLPVSLPRTLALGLALLGAVATAIGELPTFFAVLRGAAIPGGFTYEDPKAR